MGAQSPQLTSILSGGTPNTWFWHVPGKKEVWEQTGIWWDFAVAPTAPCQIQQGLKRSSAGGCEAQPHSPVGFSSGCGSSVCAAGTHTGRGGRCYLCRAQELRGGKSAACKTRLMTLLSVCREAPEHVCLGSCKCCFLPWLLGSDGDLPAKKCPNRPWR